MHAFQAFSDDFLAKIDETLFDLLVIGGGIVGAGVARDAAMRGLRTVLVEQQDFAAGASSRSSRLLHGGLRYLAQGRIGLVREASLEKGVLHEIAPHLVEPLAFVFPAWRGCGWPKWKLWLGVKVYDLLAGRNFGRSRGLSTRETLELLPGLETSGLTGGVRYYDALTNDARLVLDSLRSGVTHGLTVRNYCRFEGAERQDDRWLATCRDRRTNDCCRIRARSIVNATGPWSDRLEHSGTRLRLTKGVHLVVDRARLPVPDAVVMPEGPRILFAIPWGERVVLGTTDTDYNGPLESPQCEPDDVQYVLDVVNRAFPDTALSPADVISTWAGLRPLVADSRGRPTDISRHHEIERTQPGWWDVTGGKLTTYRLMAEQTVDRIVRELDAECIPCKTAHCPLLPSDQTNGISGILPPAVSRQLVSYYCREEWPLALEDVMVRRTGWHYYRTDRLDVARQVAQWMAGELGWDQGEIGQQIVRYRDS